MISHQRDVQVFPPRDVYAVRSKVLVSSVIIRVGNGCFSSVTMAEFCFLAYHCFLHLFINVYLFIFLIIRARGYRALFMFIFFSFILLIHKYIYIYLFNLNFFPHMAWSFFLISGERKLNSSHLSFISFMTSGRIFCCHGFIGLSGLDLVIRSTIPTPDIAWLVVAKPQLAAGLFQYDFYQNLFWIELFHKLCCVVI